METIAPDKFEQPNYLDPFSIMVVNQKGELKRLYCPFVVICRREWEGILEGKQYRVDMVKLEPSNLILFVISGRTYSHSLFCIYLKG
jgi:hypothetical protein